MASSLHQAFRWAAELPRRVPLGKAGNVHFDHCNALTMGVSDFQPVPGIDLATVPTIDTRVFIEDYVAFFHSPVAVRPMSDVILVCGNRVSASTTRVLQRSVRPAIELAGYECVGTVAVEGHANRYYDVFGVRWDVYVNLTGGNPERNVHGVQWAEWTAARAGFRWDRFGEKWVKLSNI